MTAFLLDESLDEPGATTASLARFIADNGDLASECVSDRLRRRLAFLDRSFGLLLLLLSPAASLASSLELLLVARGDAPLPPPPPPLGLALAGVADFLVRHSLSACSMAEAARSMASGVLARMELM